MPFIIWGLVVTLLTGNWWIVATELEGLFCSSTYEHSYCLKCEYDVYMATCSVMTVLKALKLRVGGYLIVWSGIHYNGKTDFEILRENSNQRLYIYIYIYSKNHTPTMVAWVCRQYFYYTVWWHPSTQSNIHHIKKEEITYEIILRPYNSFRVASSTQNRHRRSVVERSPSMRRIMGSPSGIDIPNALIWY